MRYSQTPGFFGSSLLGVLILLSSCGSGPAGKSDKEMQQWQEPLVKVNRYLVKKDRQTILQYIRRHGQTFTESPTGLWYQIEPSPTGQPAREGSAAIIRYSLHLLDGTLCYSTDSLGPERVLIGHTQGIESGLTEGLLMMKEGDKARFILPPHLAHGLLGDEKRIPPRSILLYDIEMLRLQ